MRCPNFSLGRAFGSFQRIKTGRVGLVVALIPRYSTGDGCLHGVRDWDDFIVRERGAVWLVAAVK